MKFLLCLFLSFPVVTRATIALTDKKSSAVEDMTAGCANSLITPSLRGFMASAQAAGKPFADEDVARKALEQKQLDMAKSDFYKNQLEPAAKQTCRCLLEETLSKIRGAKTEAEIEIFIKEVKPEPAKSKECSEKFLLPVLRKMK